MTTVGAPSNALTFEKASTTEFGSERSLGMLIWSAVLSDSFTFRAARATLYPFAAKARATWAPILGPEPRMRRTGDVEDILLNFW